MVDLGSTGSIVDKKKKKRLDIYTRRLCGLNAVFQTQTSCSTTWVQQQDENNYHEWVFHICGCAGVLPMSYTYFTKTLVVTVGFQKFHIEKLISTAHTRASSVWILIFFLLPFFVSFVSADSMCVSPWRFLRVYFFFSLVSGLAKLVKISQLQDPNRIQRQPYYRKYFDIYSLLFV